MRKIVSKDTIERAISILQARGEEDEVEVEPIILARNVSLARARRFMAEKHEVIVRYVDGSLIAVDLARAAHGITIGKIMSISINDANLRISTHEDLESANNFWQPDCLVEPWDLRNPGNPRTAQPTVIVEVGDAESLQSVFRCATHYLNKPH